MKLTIINTVLVFFFHTCKPGSGAKTILILFFLLLNSCIVQFIPEISEEQELLVVEGLVTDQPQADTIKLSRSLPLGEKSAARPQSGCTVKILDDLGNSFILEEIKAGTYITNSATFKGEIGRSYTLQITTNNGLKNQNYESFPMEMKPVPPIDSIYYEKKIVKEDIEGWFGIDACQIYLDTHDPENICKFYRWDYSETWVHRLLFPVPNMICWISDVSEKTIIKSTAAFEESRITRNPVTYITNYTDRLKWEYSILVNQYSLNEEEYIYWEKVQNFTDQVGGLYDLIPASIPGNIFSLNNPNEKVLGYFSVSAMSSKRIFIKENFAGIIDRYDKCVTDTIYGDYDPPELNVSLWTLIDHPASFYPRTRVLTDNYGCYDCRTRGTNKKPDFWIDDK
jgi:hypothetical protein